MPQSQTTDQFMTPLGIDTEPRVLSFFSYVGLDPASTFYPQNIKKYQAPKKF